MSRGDTRKRLRLLMRYYFRGLRRRVFSALPYILFALSFLLFLSILVPNVVLRVLPIADEWPRVLELHGTVLEESNETDSGTLVSVSGAIVEIGGYRAITDANGEFYIKFVSDSSNDIPLVISWSDRSVVMRVTYESGQFRKTEVFVLNG